MTKTLDFRADLAPFRRAVAEMLSLSRALGPEGLTLLREFSTLHRAGGFSISQTLIVDGVATVRREPSAATLEFLADLRRRAGKDAA